MDEQHILRARLDALAGSVRDVMAVDVHIAGCPPRPEAIIEALRGLSDQ